MAQFIQWLGRNKILAILLAIAVYFSIVAFHQAITDLAIRLRNALGRDKYNEYLAYAFLLMLLAVIALLVYYSLKSRQRYLKLVFSSILTAMIVFSFRFLMVYSIEAIHFVEYMLVAIILFPVLRSYGETVFWVTLLGILDELFQYRFLTPDFEYFDFNDITLNLLGAGAGAFMVFICSDNVVKIRRMKWYSSPAFLTGLGMLAAFFILLLSGKMSINPAATSGSDIWFSINRKIMPDEFWTTAYPGRVFHILRPFEGISLLIFLWTGFSMLDVFALKSD